MAIPLRPTDKAADKEIAVFSRSCQLAQEFMEDEEDESVIASVIASIESTVAGASQQDAIYDYDQIRTLLTVLNNDTLKGFFAGMKVASVLMMEGEEESMSVLHFMEDISKENEEQQET